MRATTEVRFDPLLAMQECHRHQGQKAQKGDQKREIEALVLSQGLSPQDCGAYAEMLDQIAEAEAQADFEMGTHTYAPLVDTP